MTITPTTTKHVRNALARPVATSDTSEPVTFPEPTVFLELIRDNRAHKFYLDVRNRRAEISATRFATLSRLLETGEYGKCLTRIGPVPPRVFTWELTSDQGAALKQRVKTGRICPGCGVVLLDDEGDLCYMCEQEMEADDLERELIAERAACRL